MADDPRLEEILLEWETGVASGAPMTAETLCAESPELLKPLRERIRILESMGGVLDLSPFEEGSEVLEPKQALPPPGFIPLQELGRGGMAVVYKAWQFGAERMVALKLILGGNQAGGKFLARFHAEAQAVAQLHHPNIVAVLEVGNHQGVPFLAMEFVAGGNLKSYLEKNLPTPAESALLLEGVARGIHVAHEHRIIHRDLKPANILLQETSSVSHGSSLNPGRDSTDHHPTSPSPPPVLIPKIADFGLARHLDRSVGLTTSGAILGTPGYMSPEQTAGKNDQLGPATDIFGLGVILYEMVTGRLPYDPTRGNKKFDKMPAKPSSHNTACPAALDNICLRCLQIDAEERYSSALELAEELGRFHEGQVVGGAAVVQEAV